MLLGEKNDKVGILDISEWEAVRSGMQLVRVSPTASVSFRLRKTKLDSRMNALNSLRSNSRARIHPALFAKSF